MKIPEIDGDDGSSSDESSSIPEGLGDPTDFSEYMWMENQDEFDRQVLQELEQVVGSTPSSPRDPGDFSEFMWMENEEQFDQEVLQQLEEEAMMKHCIESMLEDEAPSSKNSDFVRDFNNLRVRENPVELAKKSTLNPNAAEFVPKVALESK